MKKRNYLPRSRGRTVPGQAYTVKRILEMYTTGVDVNTADASWAEGEDETFDDVADYDDIVDVRDAAVAAHQIMNEYEQNLKNQNDEQMQENEHIPQQLLPEEDNQQQT